MFDITLAIKLFTHNVQVYSFIFGSSKYRMKIEWKHY